MLNLATEQLKIISKQVSGQSAHGTGLIKNSFDTIENGVENLDFAHDQVDIQRQFVNQTFKYRLEF